jgi:hypothetical protein
MVVGTQVAYRLGRGWRGAPARPGGISRGTAAYLRRNFPRP